MARFSDDFGGGGAEDNEDIHDANGHGHKSSKPSDFTALFKGNSDDHFMIGIKFTRLLLFFFSAGSCHFCCSNIKF